MIRLLVLISALMLVANVATAAKHAFVLGNSAYDELSDLQNTHNDARAYANAFNGLGYEVTHLGDLGLDDFEEALERFLSRIKPGDDVAFVFSGHGWSDGSTNYLIPTDAPKQGRDRKLKRLSIALSNGSDGILDAFEAAGANLVVAIVDACRDNPFSPSFGAKSMGISRGLAPVKPATGTFVIYSAGEGQQALDRLPDDPPGAALSVFTRAFIPYLRPGVLLEDAISNAQVETAQLAARADGHLQHPAYYDQTLGGTCLGGVCQASMPAPSPCDALYAEAKEAQACFAYDAYLNACGDHTFSPLAKSYLNRKCADDEVVTTAVVQPPKKTPKPGKAPVSKPDIGSMSDALTLVSWGGAYQKSQEKAYAEPYTSLNRGLRISWDQGSAEAVSKLRKMQASNNVTWDLVDVVGADAVRLCEEGLVMKVDHDALLAPAPDGTPASWDFGPSIASECFIPQIAYSVTVGYRGDLMGGKKPNSICDLFDTRTYPGKRALSGRVGENLEWALLCDGVAREKVHDVLATKTGQNRAFAKLETIKDDVVWWRSGAEPIQLLSDGEVVMASAYNGRLFQAIAYQDLPVEMLWDAQVLDFDGWVIPAGLPQERLARVRDFLWFATDTQRLADQAQYIAYGPARASAARLVGRHAELGIDMAPHIPTAPSNMRNVFVANYDFWADNRRELQARFQAWLVK